MTLFNKPTIAQLVRACDCRCFSHHRVPGSNPGRQMSVAFFAFLHSLMHSLFVFFVHCANNSCIVLSLKDKETMPCLKHWMAPPDCKGDFAFLSLFFFRKLWDLVCILGIFDRQWLNASLAIAKLDGKWFDVCPTPQWKGIPSLSLSALFPKKLFLHLINQKKKCTVGSLGKM